MRPVALGQPLSDSDADVLRWARQALAEIETASQEGVELVADAFEFTGSHTERRTIDAGAATLAELRDYVATLVNDLKKRGATFTE